MFFKRIDIEEILTKEKAKSGENTALLSLVQKILEDQEHSNQFTLVNKMYLDKLESDKVYHISEIKKICVLYRLRFLDQSFYKLKLPLEAEEKIKLLNNLHDTHLHSFKIIAPAKSLKLENYDDPLLFAPIGNDYYYFIHKWGNDLHSLRRVQSWPMKNLGNITVFIFIVALLTTLLLPIKSYNSISTSSITLIIFLFVFKTYCAIFIYYFFWKGKQFSISNWDSKYYN